MNTAELYRLEALGRAYAYDIAGGNYAAVTYGELLEWFRDVYNALRGLSNELKDVQFYFDTMGVRSSFDLDQYRSLITHLDTLVTQVINILTHYSNVAPSLLSETSMVVWGYLQLNLNVILRQLSDCCSVFKQVLGKTVCWPMETPSLSGLINNITTLFHSLILVRGIILGELGQIEHLSPKASVTYDASEISRQILVWWDKATAILNTHGLYNRVDYESLMGFAFDDIVELRVGSAAGHLTKVNLPSSIILYYDSDLDVARTLGAMFNMMGGRYVSRVEDEHKYDFRGITHKWLAMILATPTSMDFRVRQFKNAVESVFDFFATTRPMEVSIYDSLSKAQEYLLRALKHGDDFAMEILERPSPLSVLEWYDALKKLPHFDESVILAPMIQPVRKADPSIFDYYIPKLRKAIEGRMKAEGIPPNYEFIPVHIYWENPSYQTIMDNFLAEIHLKLLDVLVRPNI